MSQLFAWGGQSNGVSASSSVLPINTQHWSPLGWTGWISSQSKGLWRVFSNTTIQKDPFFGTRLSSQSNPHIHTWPLEKPRCHINDRMGLFEHMPDLDSAHCCWNHKSKDSFLHVMYQEPQLLWPRLESTQSIQYRPWYWYTAVGAVLCLVAQSCLTLCNPMDGSLPGFSVHGILQARKQEWVAMPSSRESPQPRDQTQVSRIAGGFFTVWGTREALTKVNLLFLFTVILFQNLDPFFNPSCLVLLSCWILFLQLEATSLLRFYAVLFLECLFSGMYHIYGSDLDNYKAFKWLDSDCQNSSPWNRMPELMHSTRQHLICWSMHSSESVMSAYYILVKVNLLKIH